MLIRYLPISAARAYVATHHRHLSPPPGAIFALGAYKRGELCGVALVGRPASRQLAAQGVREVTRVATDGTRNACSALYGACWREARRRGWLRLVTYTRADEPGTSLRAAGWRPTHVTKVEPWSRTGRPRQLADLIAKVRWERP